VTSRSAPVQETIEGVLAPVHEAVSGATIQAAGDATDLTRVARPAARAVSALGQAVQEATGAPQVSATLGSAGASAR
jgi:hypothetical protein